MGFSIRRVTTQVTSPVVYGIKVCMSEDGEGRWERIVGSANSTRSAFSTNSEMTAQNSSDSLGADEAYWSEGRQVDYSDPASYADVLWKKRWR